MRTRGIFPARIRNLCTRIRPQRLTSPAWTCTLDIIPDGLGNGGNMKTIDEIIDEMADELSTPAEGPTTQEARMALWYAYELGQEAAE